ncbi:MAG: hypothetical protein PWQ79_1934 [Thermococcaceae archaeon]|nr:hypothetical protein [Thermococcaceae archaeon]
MNRKILGLLIAVVMLLSVVPAGLSIGAVSASPAAPSITTGSSDSQETPKFIPGDVVEKQIERILRNKHGGKVRLIIAPEKDRAMEVYEALKNLGRIDPISRPEYQFIVVEMPAGNLEKLKEIPGILRVWEDRIVKLLEPVEPEEALKALKENSPAKPDMFMSVFEINAVNVWNNYGILGDNVTVAVLDTGIDVSHPFLQTTLDGRPKIIDIYDASDEGIAQLYYATNTTLNGTIVVNMEVPVYWGAYYPYYGHDKITTYYNMTSYFVGNITGDEYYLGLLPERYFDLNNFFGTPNDPYNLGLFGDLSDVYPVLIVENNGTYTAYIDYNLNNNFTDDQPIGLFTETGDYFQTPDTLVSIALAKVHIGDMDNPDNYPYIVPYGDGIGYAMFMWDPHGHGTHVSGTVAGVGQPDDPMFRGVYGVAPNAQLIEVKVLPGEVGFGRTSWIINGMFYAALKGADVISMSLGGGGEINDGIESPENFYANRITDLFGVVFAIAAGNEGPSTNTVHSPGTSDLVITVGNYVGNEREAYRYRVDLGIMSGPSMSSSRGPRDDGMLDPDVMAPGTDIFSSLPMWYTVLYENPYRYYGIWSGTSMATPHVSGAVALMISYAKAQGLRYDPFMIKRALELSAKPTNQTLIDQGFGLIQVDKAIEKLEELSQEPTTYIYGGTTFTSFKNPIEVPQIPISPAYIEFNSYFYFMFGLPYLYRGVYLRNEYPVSVPLQFYPMDYIPGYGLNFTANEKAYKISTNVDWIIPSTNAVVAGNNTIGEFSINIDYSRLHGSNTYVGLVYIDDPDTSYVDGFIPVIVDYPMNPNGETHVKLSDTEKPGEARHYFVQVPRGTKELRITLRVPADENGVPMGRTKLVIARPLGGVEYDGVPDYYYVGANPSGYLYNYTWVVENPVEGTWEITAYSSTFTKYYSGYSESHYEIEVELASVSISPQLIKKDVSSPSLVDVSAVVTNNYGTFNASAVGYGVGRLDEAYAFVSEVNQSDWDVIRLVYVDPTTYFIRFGITQPEDPNADLDLYVYYFPTYDDYLNFENYILYYEQIGPTSDEVFEQFMPAPGYYLIEVYGYDTVGYNPIHYLFYYQILGDNGDVTIDSTPFTFSPGSKTINAQVNLSDEGTYLGVLGLVDADTGDSMVYAPMIFQVGQPEMLIVGYGEATLGQESTLHIKVLNKTSMEPVDAPATVTVNGRPYYTTTGEVEATFIPEELGQISFNVKASSPVFKDAETTITVNVKEPLSSPVEKINDAKFFIAGSGRITKTVISERRFNDGYRGAAYLITADGPSGEVGYITIAAPVDSEVYQVSGEPHLLDYTVVKGKNAVYIILKVQYASPVTVGVTVKVKPQRMGVAFNVLNFLYYQWYQNKVKEFEELYQKALEAGVDESVLQEALQYNQTAAEHYQKALDIAGGNILLRINDFKLFGHLRNAYFTELQAVEILKEALGE